MIRPKNILTALTALWVLVAMLEGASSFIRFLYSRRMNAAVRAASGLVGYAKAALMVVLAVSNAMLFIRYVDDGQKRAA